MRRRFLAWALVLRLVLGVGAGTLGAAAPRPHVLEGHLRELADEAADSLRWQEGTTETERILRTLPYYERLLRERGRVDGQWSLAVGRLHARLGRLHWRLRRRAQAQEHLGRAVEILKAQLGSDRQETQEVASDYADAMRRRTYSGRAEPRLREAWHAVQAATGPYDEPELPDHQARRAERLAEAAFRAGRLERAEMLYQRVLRQWLPLLGPGHPRVIRTRWRLARISRRLADPHEVPATMTAEAHQEFWRRCERLSSIDARPSPVRLMD